MKSILFICGCLEQGKDGVGDYTRRFAGELSDRGIQVRLVSLSDNYAGKISEKIEFSPLTSGEMKIIRIPRNVSWKMKLEKVRLELLEFSPDLISFQIVPFSFNPYGILNKAYPFFIKIGQGFRSHIMFHELWIGNQLGASLKERLGGYLGKRYILKMIKGLRPVKIHSNSDLSIFLLKKSNVEASKLPVFSNISIVPKPESRLKLLFDNTELQWAQLDRVNSWIFSFFGAIHHEWNPEKFMVELKRISALTDKRIIICSIGRTDTMLWNKLKDKYKSDFDFLFLGERTPEEISTFLQEIDFGISSYPDILIEKSGTIAALRQHRIPVILSRNELIIPGFSMESNPQPFLYRLDELETLMTNKVEKIEKGEFYFDVQQVANLFLMEMDAEI